MYAGTKYKVNDVYTLPSWGGTDEVALVRCLFDDGTVSSGDQYKALVEKFIPAREIDLCKQMPKFHKDFEVSFLIILCTIGESTTG